MALSTPDAQMTWTPSQIAENMRRGMNEHRQAIGLRLKQLRESRNLSQEETAHLVGCTVKTWHNWESGKTKNPYESSWAKIAEAFDVDVQSIRGNDERQLDRIEEALVEIGERLAHIEQSQTVAAASIRAFAQTLIQRQQGRTPDELQALDGTDRPKELPEADA